MKCKGAKRKETLTQGLPLEVSYRIEENPQNAAMILVGLRK